MPKYRCNMCGHEEQVDSSKLWFRGTCQVKKVPCVMRRVVTRSQRRRKARGLVAGQAVRR